MTCENTSYETLLVEHDGPAGIVTINRPKVLNALSATVMRELGEAVSHLAAHEGVRGIIITGAGDRAFVAGADINQFGSLDPRTAYRFALQGGQVLRLIETVDIPVVAAVNGFALGGGCELALACDFIVASTRAKFGQPEVKLGIIPGYGGTQRMARLLGKNLARYVCMTGDVFDAAWALRVGLAVEVVEPDELLPRCKAIIATIAERGPLAVAQVKRVVDKGHDLALDTALDVEAAAFAGLFATRDRVEGTSAFLEKRTPDFKGE